MLTPIQNTFIILHLSFSLAQFIRSRTMNLLAVLIIQICVQPELSGIIAYSMWVQIAPAISLFLEVYNLSQDTYYLSRWDHFYTLKKGSSGCIHLPLLIYEAVEGNIWIEHIYGDILVVTNVKISFGEIETWLIFNQEWISLTNKHLHFAPEMWQINTLALKSDICPMDSALQASYIRRIKISAQVHWIRLISLIK